MASFIGNDCLVINSWDVGEVQLVRDEFSDGILRVTLNDGSIHNAPVNFFRDVFGWILRCGGAASPVWREPPVRTNGTT